MEFSEKNIFNSIKYIMQWDVLGIQLGFRSDQLAIIKRDSSDINGAIIQLVGDWIRNDKNASWKTLAHALQQMGQNKLADSLYNQEGTGIEMGSVV